MSQKETNKLDLSLFEKLMGWKIASKCGHKTKRKGKITAFGESCKMEMSEPIEYCLECIGKKTIKCAWCEKPIFIGDPITLYSPVDKEKFELPKEAVIYNQKNMQVVGCLHMGCADGADRSGFWLPDGAKRVLSPIEECLATGDMVIVNDLGSINEAKIVK